MEKRRLGRTEHMSTVAIFGAVAFWDISQEGADAVMEDVMVAGVNHIDVAPGYRLAETRLGPWMPKIREKVFLGCKTGERGKDGAAAEMQRSLNTLQVDSFDLYQFHAVTNIDELDMITAPGGALEAVIEARGEGLTRFIGITGHGQYAPATFIEALDRFDFDTVMFPLNYIFYTDATYRRDTERLLGICQERDVGVMIIKTAARGTWEGEQTYNTWYRPFDEMESIQAAVNFVLSQDVTGLCTTGEVQILPKVLEACQKFTPLNADEQAALIQSGTEFEPLFALPT
ncbi:MAG: aldo/keto reductase [Anaerolineales bacterium]|nr:aldo/keto reductase [Chloroflexota bacterium]MBL6980933.1 aldo/keto reductase [Anaerolineales bacterium]